MEEIIKPFSLYKEVIVTYGPGFWPRYEETLKISKNNISYFKDCKTLSSFENEGMRYEAWDYITTNDSFKDKFEELCKLIDDCKVDDHSESLLDAPMFEITLKYNVGKKKEIVLWCDVNYYWSNFNDYQLRRIANIMLDMIPSNASYPRCLAHQKASDLSDDDIYNALEWLKKNHDVDYKMPEKSKEGVITIAYPEYPKEIYVLLESIEPCFDYEKKAKRLLEITNMEVLDYEDLRVLFTYLLRGEKFCDGLILSFIKNGKLLAWASRLAQIYDEEFDNFED